MPQSQVGIATPEIAVHDVVIIGAGPCGLAVAARLQETHPSALFTDVEHQRFHWIRKHRHHAPLVRTKGRARNMVLLEQTSNEHSCLGRKSKANQYKIQVFDSTSGNWMRKWTTLFRAFDIKTLRSPLVFHPDPSDRDGLKAYVYAKGRDDEMVQLRGVVGKEISKHKMKKARKRGKNCKAPRGKSIDERDLQDYQTPATSLFDDFCSDCVSRYDLGSLIQQTDVKSICFDKIGSLARPDDCFTITTSTEIHYARTVVLAIGSGTPTTPPSIPLSHPGSLHSSQLPSYPFPPRHIALRISCHHKTTVLVLGGGLTSAQISDLCIRRGVNKVIHLTRRPLKIKHFDLDLPWVAKYKNLEISAFHLADSDDERAKLIKAARGGGSVTPVYRAVLAKHEAAGRLEIRECTRIVSQFWNEESLNWKVQVQSTVSGLEAELEADFMYYATGAAADIEAVPCLREMLENWPIVTAGGSPCLTDDLMWKEAVPLFVTGRYAGLRVGPGAANLEGARVAAERIVWRLKEVLDEGGEGAGAGAEARDGDLEEVRRKFEDGSTHLNMYDVLIGKEGE